MEFPRGQNLAPQRIRPKGVADIVVCIDCTASMGNCIDGVKENVQEFVEGLESTEQIKLDWRVRLIEYRDLKCNEKMVSYPFTTSIDEFKGWVQMLEASGGGDEPESTLDALFKALDSDWRRESNKCIVVFTDATTHREMHPSTVEPGQPKDVDEVINKIYSSRARVFLFGPKFDIYSTLAEVERVIYKEVTGSGLKDVDFKDLMDFIGKTVSASTEPTPMDIRFS